MITLWLMVCVVWQVDYAELDERLRKEAVAAANQQPQQPPL